MQKSCSSLLEHTAKPPEDKSKQGKKKRPPRSRGPLSEPIVRADEPNLTSHAGLLPLIRFINQNLGLGNRFRAIVGPPEGRRVHPVHLVLLAFVVFALAGIQRLAHIECLRADKLLLQHLRLHHLPVRKVFSSALASLSDVQRDALVDLVSEMGLASLPKGTSSVIVDIDPTAIVSYGEAENAGFGYCGKGRRRRRHYPIVATLAQTGSIIHLRYRDGSGITADETTSFLEEVIVRVRSHLGADCKIFIRGDAGVWCPRVGRWLQAQGVSFVMAMPMHAGVKLFLHQASFTSLEDDPDIQVALLDGEKVGAGKGLRVAVIRRRVHDLKAPPQGKKIKGDPDWRYQAVVSDLPWSPEDLWRFYNGRAACEKVFRVGKQSLAMDHLVGHSYRANESAFLLRCLAYNVDLRFQAWCEERARAASRKVVRVGLEWRQPRFYQSPGRLVRHGGRRILRVPENPFLAKLWSFYAPDLFEQPGADKGGAAA